MAGEAKYFVDKGHHTVMLQEIRVTMEAYLKRALKKSPDDAMELKEFCEKLEDLELFNRQIYENYERLISYEPKYKAALLATQENLALSQSLLNNLTT